MSASESVTPRLYAEALAASQRRTRATSVRLFRSALVYAEAVVDFLTCAAGMSAAYFVVSSGHMGTQIQYPVRGIVAASIVVGLSAVLFLQRSGTYRGGGSLLQIQETARAIRVPAQSVLLLLTFGLLFDMNVSYAAVFVALLLIPALFILQKLIFFSILRKLQGLGYGRDRAVVYGAGDAGKGIVSALFHSLRLGLLPVAVIEDNPALNESCIFEMGYRRRQSVPIHRGPVTPELLRSYQCTLLILALPNLSPERRRAAADAAEEAGLRIAVLSGTELKQQRWTQSIDLDVLPLTPVVEPVAAWYYTLAKRIADIIVSSLLLVLGAPLFFLIALLISIDSTGPALFVQKRVGRDGELFKMYKFRSMYRDAPEYDFSPTTSADPRITRIGRFIRRASLDELPQLVNVFLGNMSLVGPRPEMPFIVQGYTSEQRQRLQVVPGITGLWQLSADRAFPIHKNIQYDLYYIRNRGFFMDIAILIHTLLFAIPRGV